MNRLITAIILSLTFATANAAPVAAKTDLPAGEYKLDKSHSSIVFAVSHIGFSQYTMQFKTFDAKLNLDPAKPQNAKIEVTIDPLSLDIPAPPAGFKDELLGEKWLDTKANPKITFKSTKIELMGEKTAKITGDLTLHGVTKPIVLNAVFNGGYNGLPDLDPNARVGFSAMGKFKRSDFGISYAIPAPGTTMGVGDEVSVVIETEFSGPALKK